MLDSISRSRPPAEGGSHTPTHGCTFSHGSRHVIVRTQVALLHLLLAILHKRSRSGLIDWTLQRISMRNGAVRHHHRRDIWRVGIRRRIRIDVVVLRRDVLVWRVVSRHLFSAGRNKTRRREMVLGNGRLAGRSSTSSVTPRGPTPDRDPTAIASSRRRVSARDGGSEC